MREFALPAALRACVAQMAVYRERIAAGQQVHKRVLPDGAVHLVFNFGDAPTADGTAGPQVAAVGASATPVVLALQGELHGVSLTLRPGAAMALLGVPAGEIRGAAVPLDELWRGEASRLLEQMAAAPGDAQRVALLQAALLRRLREHEAALHGRVLQAVRLIRSHAGRLSPQEVAQKLEIGERRLQQLFQSHVGLTPRAFGRLARLDEELTIYRCHAGGASQRFRTAMGESAAKVLAERYAPVLGDEAAEAAGLVVAHLMAREPVPDAAALDRLFGFVERLHRDFLAATDPDPAARKRIEREYSRLWWQVTRTALRTHPIGLWDAMAARPKGLRVRPQADMLVSPLVGRARALGRSFGGLARAGS